MVLIQVQFRSGTRCGLESLQQYGARGKTKTQNFRGLIPKCRKVTGIFLCYPYPE